MLDPWLWEAGFECAFSSQIAVDSCQDNFRGPLFFEIGFRMLDVGLDCELGFGISRLALEFDF